jgi:hypothetical protein
VTTKTKENDKTKEELIKKKEIFALITSKYVFPVILKNRENVPLCFYFGTETRANCFLK